jgi:hypothetical protein
MILQLRQIGLTEAETLIVYSPKTLRVPGSTLNRAELDKMGYPIILGHPGVQPSNT